MVVVVAVAEAAPSGEDDCSSDCRDDATTDDVDCGLKTDADCADAGDVGDDDADDAMVAAVVVVVVPEVPRRHDADAAADVADGDIWRSS